jgi:hypothetical protein
MEVDVGSMGGRLVCPKALTAWARTNAPQNKVSLIVFLLGKIAVMAEKLMPPTPENPN